jgi:hypothetical protein
MKAQSVRRFLWTSNVALALAAGGVAFWYVSQVRPASASTKKEAWLEASWKLYGTQKQSIQPAILVPVSAEDFDKHLTHKTDWMSPRVGVWPYVGPVPPDPRPVEVVVEKPPQPTGLEAIGTPSMILYSPPDRSVVKWVFTASKKAKFFSQGEWFTEGPQKEGGRFKLVSVERVGPEESRFRIGYEVYDDPKQPPVKSGSSEFTLFKETAPAKPPTATPGPADPKGGPPPGPAPKEGGIDVAAAGTPPKPVLETPTENSRRIRFEQDSYDWIGRVNPDSIIAQVQTEEAKNADGTPKGIRVTGIAPGSIASDFDIRQGDILKSINGTPVHSRGQAANVVKSLPKDVASVAVVIERNGRDILYDVDPRDPKVRAAAGRVGFNR